MKKITSGLLLVFLIACQSVKINKENYDVSNSIVELGSIGSVKSSFTKNTFESNAFPVLENKIRLTVEIVPFSKKTAKSYFKKNKYNQNAAKLNYVDSLDVKPEMMVLKIADKLGYVTELNESYNEKIFNLLSNSSDFRVVSSVAVFPSNEELMKIKQSDAYYLVNNQDKKYTVALYNEGKKTGTLELKPERILGYQSGSFCWSSNAKGKWYVADMVNSGSSCQGKSFSKIKEDKREESLFKM
ncbi:hypothetical protein NAT51_12890 [Flavobacterium amniphilum]|uniref:hypothetical protein n=1 Tax=Flavobacterium amniphilum TaxID=1834035 RepID=UPI00202A6DB2|nr:hypothetical protein [Flavobacterium amniphilum]MCL9806426.1 hypothetical protein [Flavobacterium amniphilum]